MDYSANSLNRHLPDLCRNKGTLTRKTREVLRQSSGRIRVGANQEDQTIGRRMDDDGVEADADS